MQLPYDPDHNDPLLTSDHKPNIIQMVKFVSCTFSHSMIAEIFGEKNIDRIRVFYILTLEYTDIHVLVRRYNEPTDEQMQPPYDPDHDDPLLTSDHKPNITKMVKFVFWYPSQVLRFLDIYQM
jgi:hypothetical protein